MWCLPSWTLLTSFSFFFPVPSKLSLIMRISFFLIVQEYSMCICSIHLPVLSSLICRLAVIYVLCVCVCAHVHTCANTHTCSHTYSYMFNRHTWGAFKASLYTHAFSSVNVLGYMKRFRCLVLVHSLARLFLGSRTWLSVSMIPAN